MSLQSRVTALMTVIIVTISLVSTVIFTTAYSQSKEKGRISRGTALSYALSHAAQEGLVNEDLDLIKKASGVIKAPDVTLAQVYSGIWETLDAYPIEKLTTPPGAEAVAHFRVSKEPFSLKTAEGYDFYSPILYSPAESGSPVSIGYVRVSLSSSTIQKELRQIVVTNSLISLVITLIAVFSLNLLVRRMVISPVMSLYKSMSLFKNGVMPEDKHITGSAHEMHELAEEFYLMCRTIREKEDRLTASEQRVRSLFEQVEHAIFRLDGRGVVTETNSRFREMFGDASELCDILTGEKNTNDCLGRAGAEKVFHMEDRVSGKNGEEIIIALSLYPERDSGGAITGYNGYIMDVTEKKRLQERLIRSQKMEAVGTLAGGMAHDFNNLLTAILGYAEIILSMTKEGDPFNRPATVIYDAALRGADFGKRILAITRKEKIEMKLMNVNEIVVKTLELLSRSMSKNIEIVSNLMKNLPNIKADPSQLQQVIMNLAVNASDAMPTGGRLFVETALVGSESGAFGGVQGARNGLIRLSVSDTGVGIDRETQTKIFDPFYTTKQLGKGTGLGLYIVHSIIHNHGGYINVYSEPRKGTQFNVYLPVTLDAESEEIPEVLDTRGLEMILIIDDEQDVRELCRDMLEPLGYSVLLAENGSAGIQTYRELKGKISLVVLDMIMPKMSGSEVFNSLKMINPGVRVLLCSGFSQDGFGGIDDLLNLGAAGFIQKPFTRQSLSQSIRKVLSEGKVSDSS